MPVAADRTLDMGASEGKTIGEVHILEVSTDTPQKTPRRKIRKSRPLVNQQQPLAGSSSLADDPNWTWRSLTESAASKVTPLFTKDGSYFVSATGPAVKIYSVSTGLLVSTLSPVGTLSRPAEPTGYGDAVTSMAFNPHNPFQLITGSLDGCIRVWDIVDAILMQTIDVADPVLLLALHEKFKNEVYVALSRRTKVLNRNRNPSADDNVSVYRVSLTPINATAKLPVQKSSDKRKIGKTRGPLGLAFSASGSWLVAIGGQKAYVAKTADLKSGFTKFVSPDKLMCLAFHPSEEYFATGDQKGVVRLWYCLNDNLPAPVSGVEKRAPTTTMHWHPHAVSSIAFSANGAYLLSGGEEAVLVIWQLHTGKKEFVPRVGSPITTITVSKAVDEQYLLGLADASFVFVRSSTLKISKTIARVKLDPAISYSRDNITSVPLAVHSLSSSLVLPSSHPSTLQTYAPLTSKLLSEIEVSPSNRVPRRDEEPIEPCRVEMSAISEGGEWMATVDARLPRDALGGEVYLKIWSWDRKSSLWTLNTRVDRPHGLKKVSSLSFRPGGVEHGSESLVTTGEDGTIKVWGIHAARAQTEAFWVARSTTRFRTQIPSHASWSADGSLLVVSLGAYVVLYDPSTMLAMKTLTFPECPLILSAHFVGRGGRYLALRGPRDLILWDVVTESVRWHYHAAAGLSQIFPHHREDTFVVFESYGITKTRVLKFTTDSSTPTSSHSLPFQLLSIAPCPHRWMLSKDPSSFSFVGITVSWTVVLFGDQIRLAEDDLPEARGLGVVEQVTRRTLFHDIFGKTFSEVAPKPAVVGPTSGATAPSWKGKEVEKIFDTPAYLMPPLSTLFDPLMGEFLTPRPSDESSPDHDHEEEAAAPQDEAMDMSAEGASAPIVVGNRLERIVNDAEMLAMIEFFQNHAMYSPTPVSGAYVQTNGYQSAATTKSNGIAPHGTGPATPKTNGVASTKRAHAHAQTNGVVTPAPAAVVASSPQTADSPAAKTGQKRKKSLG